MDKYNICTNVYIPVHVFYIALTPNPTITWSFAAMSSWYRTIFALSGLKTTKTTKFHFLGTSGMHSLHKERATKSASFHIMTSLWRQALFHLHWFENNTNALCFPHATVVKHSIYLHLALGGIIAFMFEWMAHVAKQFSVNHWWWRVCCEQVFDILTHS